ncbi:MAG: hypothetical protein KF686_03230 [Ramlibacter sp.]|nr:hypothetical protein [Ramlibacter sp.]
MAQAYARVRDFLAQETANGNVARNYTSQRLGDIAGEIPRLMLAQVIVRLLGEGQLEQFVRVKTSTGRGLMDVGSLAEVPQTVYDSVESFEEIPVLPENIEVTYRLPRRSA